MKRFTESEIKLLKSNRTVGELSLKLNRTPQSIYAKLKYNAINYKKVNIGRIVTPQGYILLLKPNHPNADSRGYVSEGRYKIANKLSRILRSNEVVHHKNGIKDDNRLSNLKLMTRKEHSYLHLQTAWNTLKRL